MWEKYKHLFVKTLYGSEYDLVQNYFEHAEQLERRRVDIVNTIYSAWKDKSEIEHQIVGNAIFQDSINGSDTREKVEQFRMQFRSMELLFLPDIAINSFRNGVKRFQLLSGTTAYEKLHKISYLK